MLHKDEHQLIMGQVLKDIYTDTSVAPLLGFKGGTCAYIFYDLPRFSVDLDFDLLSGDESLRETIFQKMEVMAANYGEIKDSYIKRNTIFLLLSYGDTDHNIKIEINTRNLLPNISEKYELKEYLGISMFVARREYLFAGKLAALGLRRLVAMRDVYDVHFFAKNRWNIDRESLETLTGKDISSHIADCIAIIENIGDNEILRGLGELLSAKEKIWVKNNLRKETVFLLKNYQAVL